MKTVSLPHFSQQPALSLFSGVQPDLSADLNADKDASRLAWQREMERAQMDGWLNNPLTGSAQAAPDLSEVAAMRDVRAALSIATMATIPPAVPASLPAAQQAGAVSALPSLAFPAGDVVADDRSSLSTIATALERRSAARMPQLPALDDAVHADDGQHFSAAQLRSATFTQVGQLSSEPAPSAPRISIEWSGTDARLWLGVGVNDGITSDELTRIVNEAQAMLAADGVRLLGVMCNGQPWQASTQNIGAHDEHMSAATPDTSGTSSSNRGVPFYSYFDTQQEA